MLGKVLNILNKRKNIISNISWNLSSSVLSTGVQQLMVYPSLAYIFPEEGYGSILFLIGILNILVLTMGNALGDIRLTESSEYESEKINGDFNILLLFGGIISAAILLVVCFIYQSDEILQRPLTVVLLLFSSILGVVYSYVSSLFRLKLLFREVFKLSLVSSFGYLVGLAITYYYKIWSMPFFLGYLFSVIYQAKITRFYREYFGITYKFSSTVAKFFNLSLSYFFKASMTYVDRIIIVPILGSGMLAVYTIASVFGKCSSIAIQPIANVTLGYYAQNNFKMTLKLFWLLNIVTVLGGLITYFITILLSSYFIYYVYPLYYKSAIEYSPIANAAVIISAVSSMVQPALLKFADIKWQLVIQVGHGVIVTMLSLLLIPIYGLWGFCYANLLSNVVKLLFMFYIGDRSIRYMLNRRKHNEKNNFIK